MASFNLIDQAWIPVIMDDNSNCKLSLLELFEKAHKIREIYCDYPLETISLNRFLQALLIRIYEVNKENNWLEIWHSSKFDVNCAKDYFSKWHNRFDIFDKERPFYQCLNTLSNASTPFSKLRHEDASANNSTLFDHTYDSKDYIIPIWKLATIIINAQSYSVGGGITKPFNFSGAPLIGGCTFWIKEKSLFKSLLLNTNYDNIYINNGICEWEKPKTIKCESRVPIDYIDYLTWQSRSIVFDFKSPDSFDENGNIIFGKNKAQMFFHQGDRLELEFDDPLMAKRQGNEKLLSVRFDLDKALWRNSEVIFQTAKSSGVRPPKNISFVASNLYKLGYNNSSYFEIEAYGLLNDQAKVLLRKKESLPFYPKMFVELAPHVSDFIDSAEKQAKNLYFSLETLGRYILYWSKDETSNLSKDEREDIKRFIKSLNVEKNYWAMMEALYINFVKNSSETEFESIEDYLNYKNDVFLDIFKIAETAFTNSTQNFNSTAKHLKATTLAKQKLHPINYNGEKNEQRN